MFVFWVLFTITLRRIREASKASVWISITTLFLSLLICLYGLLSLVRFSDDALLSKILKNINEIYLIHYFWMSTKIFIAVTILYAIVAPAEGAKKQNLANFFTNFKVSYQIKKAAKLSFVYVLFLGIVSLSLEGLTSLQIKIDHIIHSKIKKEIFSSTCVGYHDGCNIHSTPYARELWPESIHASTMLNCYRRSFPLGLINSERVGIPKCVRLEGMSQKETKSFLEENPLPKRE